MNVGFQAEADVTVRLAGSGATLSEFAVETSPGDDAMHLLRHALGVARNAGCAYVNFFATPRWHHWGLFRRSGFLPYRSGNYLEAGGKRFEPEVHDLDNWQLLPGDRDYH